MDDTTSLLAKLAKRTHEYNMMTGLTYCGKPWKESYQGSTSYNCPKCIAATDAEEAETQAEVADEPKATAATTTAALSPTKPETCGFMTTIGVCGHPLVEGKCRFIYHNKEQRQ
jgi:hypothetical protein